MSSPTPVRSRIAAAGPDAASEQVTRGVDAGWGGRPAARTRPAGRAVTGSPARPAPRRDTTRPAGRPAALVVPPAPPLPSVERVNCSDVIHVAPAIAVVRRRRAVAVVVLAVVLVGLVALAVRLGGAAAGPAAPAGSVPAGTAVTVVAPGETLLDVAARVAPGAERSAVVDRIRAANDLSSSLVTPGRPLVVPAAP
ncbi:LysM peptidoglycan-binding domain-containing protein [Actinomycetospora soli]|uniref:LysM peptidoglycan-binding domain-containing protein n=1 Tax=Actinomycetospora soli TaxID=2893887 RepID=UPI001E53812F|nr:LysM peptidoglycan-binding domain-containing protein [Actinomycetospora soli]MCD2189761.1 LysM peptidoglycan-binding domain-containing protein [Actinomycetospora soli]